MDIWRLFGVVRRHRVVAVLVVVAMAIIGVQSLRQVTSYAASAQVLLRPPEARGENYLRGLGPDLTAIGSTVALSLVSDGYGGRLGVRKGDTLVMVNLDQPGANLQHGGTTVGPVINIDVISDSPSSALQEMRRLIREVQSQLTRLQASSAAPESSFVQASTLAESSEATLLSGDRKRALAGLLLLTVGLVFGVAVLVDELVPRLRDALYDRAQV